MSDQAIFFLKDSGLHDEEGNKTNVRDPITASQRRSGCFLYFMMTVHPYQAGPNFNYIRMACRECIQIPLDVDGIYASIDTQILKNPHSSSPLGGFRKWEKARYLHTQERQGWHLSGMFCRKL